MPLYFSGRCGTPGVTPVPPPVNQNVQDVLLYANHGHGCLTYIVVNYLVILWYFICYLFDVQEMYVILPFSGNQSNFFNTSHKI